MRPPSECIKGRTVGCRWNCGEHHPQRECKRKTKRSQRNGFEVGGEQGDAAVTKAREEGDPKGP